jgi:hypothetical protein
MPPLSPTPHPGGAGITGAQHQGLLNFLPKLATLHGPKTNMSLSCSTSSLTYIKIDGKVIAKMSVLGRSPYKDFSYTCRSFSYTD